MSNEKGNCTLTLSQTQKENTTLTYPGGGEICARPPGKICAKYAQNMRKYALKYAQNMRYLEYAHVEPTKKWGSLDQILVKSIFLESADDADHKNILVQIF